MGIAVIQAWMNKANPEKKQASGRGKKNMLRRVGLLSLNESLVCSSSSSRVPVQRRPHAILSSQVSAQRRPHWQTLHLDEAVSLDTVAPDAVNRRAERTNMTWRSLDLDDCDDPPEPQQSRRWQTLSLDD